MTQPLKICFFRISSSAGDVFISNFFVRELKKLFPFSKLTVVAPVPTDHLYKDNPHLDRLIAIPSMRPTPTLQVPHPPIHIDIRLLISLLQTLRQIRSEKYDLLISDILLPTLRNRLFFKLCAAKRTILSTPLANTTKHRIYSYGRILDMLGAKKIDYTYELFLPPSAQEQTRRFLQQHNLTNGFIVFNPIGANSSRWFSNPQIHTLLDTLHTCLPGIPVVLLDYKHQFTIFQDKAVLCCFDDLLTVAELIKQSSFVLTVDTSILHLADVFHKDILAFYAKDILSMERNIDIFGSINPNTHYLQSKDTVADIPLAQLKQTVTKWVHTLPI